MEFDEYMQNPKIHDFIFNTRFRVDRSFDIPYVAGYSIKGDVVYVDRHLPLSMSIGKKMVALLPSIIRHERTEKALLLYAGLKYSPAHHIATYAEHQVLKERGVNPSLYEHTLDPYIKADQHEKIKRVPKDLDLKPYRDSHDYVLIEHMKRNQKG